LVQNSGNKIKDKLEYNDNFNRVQVKMPETTELILGIGALILVITLTRRYHAWQLKRAYIFIIDDLKNKGAYSAHSAVDLPYAKRNLLKMGLRQHHPQALDHLILENIVGKTEDGRYYLVQENVGF
jgi:hypothetical protein